MLLRLIPCPTASSPSPPTILFTLPEPASAPSTSTSASSSAPPTNPYAVCSLIAPPALTMHASVCKSNDLPLSTLLSGESSSWINTVVREVTFLPVMGEIQVLLVDGSGVVMPLKADGAGRCLDVVRDHVLESGRIMERGVVGPVAPRADGPSRPPLKRNGESMFMSILAPLMGKRDEALALGRSASASDVNRAHPEDAQHVSVVGKPLTARQHRRMARSSLVDCYRRFVLGSLKALLPPTYVLFTSQSLIQIEQQALRKTQAELRVLLSISGLLASTPSCSPPPSPSLSRCKPTVASPYESDFPPSSRLPHHLRTTYATHLSAYSASQLRITKLEKLVRKHEREERRSRWEDSVACVIKKQKSKVAIAASPLRASITAAEIQIALAAEREVKDQNRLSVESYDIPPLSPADSCWSSASSNSGTSSDEEADVGTSSQRSSVAVVASTSESSDEEDVFDAFELSLALGPAATETITKASSASASGAVPEMILAAPMARRLSKHEGAVMTGDGLGIGGIF